ncbi:MAG: hypothetical protein HY054_01630 [Proteobacteria bacterium]|nr:hypothetical protein [Pseudomonadota bacterium]
MRVQTLVLASIMMASLAGSGWAQSAHDSAGDYFIAAVMNTQREPVVITGDDARGRAGQSFMLANDGNATALVVGCEESCTAVSVQLSAAGLAPISASNTRDNVHAAVLQIPANYTHSLSNFEARITLGCQRPRGCYYRWALLGGAAAVPTLSQRGMRPEPTDAQWNAGAAPAGALRWLSRPSGDDLRFFYPVAAWSNGRVGSARLQCLVMADGGLRCRARNEAPAGAGFGQAARRLATTLRVNATDAAGHPTLNRRVEIPVQFSRSQ